MRGQAYEYSKWLLDMAHTKPAEVSFEPAHELQQFVSAQPLDPKVARIFKTVSTSIAARSIYKKLINAVAMSGTFHAAIKYFDQAEKPVLSAYAKKL